MPPHKREELRAVQSDVWEVIEAKPKRTVRGAQSVADPAFLNEITRSGRLKTVDSKTLRSQPRRGATPSTLDLEMEADPDAAYLVMARHESGAIVFVRPTQIERRSTARGVTASTARFSIPLPQTSAAESPEEQQRRSVVGKIVKGYSFEGGGQAGRPGHALTGQGVRERGLETQKAAGRLEIAFARQLAKERAKLAVVKKLLKAYP
jgi:hypothetical protein